MGRGSTKKSKTKTEEEQQEEVPMVQEETFLSSKPKTRQQQRNEALKSKNTGVGLKISLDTNPNQKIVFGDDEEISDIEEQEKEPEEPKKNSNEEEEDDDEDGDVEEVKGQEAREEILEQLKNEERQALKPKKRKKRKERKQVEEEKEEEEEEDFDDSFFAQLDSAREEAQQEEQRKYHPKGKHTTFVFQQEKEPLSSTPKDMDHDIQVVVLNNTAEDATTNTLFDVPPNKLSEEALLYSRIRLLDGSDDQPNPASSKRKRKQETTWKRSRKMNHLTLARARVNRRGGRGRPAANFAKKL